MVTFPTAGLFSTRLLRAAFSGLGLAAFAVAEIPEHPKNSFERHSAPGSSESTGLPGSVGRENSKSYERTRQLIENKGRDVLNPVNLLKIGSLTQLSRQDIENKLLMS